METLDGTVSSKLIGRVFDFFTGSTVRPSPAGGLGGFLGVGSNMMGGERAPFEFGDSAPLLDAPFTFGSGIWTLSLELVFMALSGAAALACGISVYARTRLRFLHKRKCFPW